MGTALVHDNDLVVGTWTIDASHSSVEFAVRHMMVSKVKGRFATFAGTITIDDDPLQSHVEATIDVASVDTHDKGRDDHLRSADFFDAATYPQMTFASTGVRPARGDYVLTGDLTIRGVTRPVELALELNGVNPDPWGGLRAGFTAETEINRKDFGLTWNAAIETGGVVVGDRIKIQLEIEAIKQ